MNKTIPIKHQHPKQKMMGLERSTFSSSVLIRVENSSGFELTARRCWVKEGEAVGSMGDLLPGEGRDMLIARSRKGNHGTLAYDIGTLNQRLIVMWTSGMNCDHFANILAIGVTSDLNTDKFNTMYFEKHPWFVRKNFAYSSDPLVIRTDMVEISATMRLHPQADINVQITGVQ
ncbi:tereporin-Ts1 [Eurytemora carolleeae]|uniref:tereporin-Ts1 n=1 Tax=Eurytemora carolleeae TaxID=1294199 RepID=UPI000C78020A|nr:tereporin-Ts1 [Eurytemora carolleeae]|eukprot:XP_023345873.1 tereporin-Ts1-like [Eurytemora affinis]